MVLSLVLGIFSTMVNDVTDDVKKVKKIYNYDDKTTKEISYSSKWKQLQSLLNTVNHILIIFVATYMTALCRSLNFVGTARHAFLGTIGVGRLRVE